MIPPKIKRPRSEFNKIDRESDVKDEWSLDFEDIEKKLNEKTKIIYLNTPHNPTGKVLTYEELNRIAKILEKYPRVIVMMDEVYEYQRGNYKELPRMASIPGMWERSITIHSAGKMFCATGIRIGWAIASEHITISVDAFISLLNDCE